MDNDLRPSEVVYSFAAWLTCRDTPITIGKDSESALVAELVARFCKANNFESPREDYHTRFVHPE